MSDLKDIRTQKEFLMEGLSSVPLDSKMYAQMLEQYKKLTETEETIKDGKRKRGLLETTLKVGAFCVTAAGALLVPQVLANMAYQKEAEFQTKNGTVWNLIGKDFSKNPFSKNDKS